MLNSANRYSSSVKILLLIAGAQFEVAQVTGDEVYFREPVEIASGDGELLIAVDNKETRKSVFLPHGVSGGATSGTYW